MKTLEKVTKKAVAKKSSSSKSAPTVGSYAAILQAAAFAKKVNLAKRYAS
jgi:hypothetical protein